VARRDPDFIIKARTDAFGTHGLDEAIRRLNLYAEAGADLLFADALASEEDIRRVARSVPGPLCVNMGFGLRTRSTTPLISARRLEAAGVAVAMYGRMLSASAIQGLKNALAAFEKSLDEEFVTERPEFLVSFDELNELMGLPDLRSLEQKVARATRA
jgi:2-methylisocitrate lyase-like PEP mutase family enzyme